MRVFKGVVAFFGGGRIVVFFWWGTVEFIFFLFLWSVYKACGWKIFLLIVVLMYFCSIYRLKLR